MTINPLPQYYLGRSVIGDRMRVVVAGEEKRRVLLLLLLWLTWFCLFIYLPIHAAINQGVIRPRTPPCFHSFIGRLQAAETKKQGKMMIWKSAFCEWVGGVVLASIFPGSRVQSKK